MTKILRCYILDDELYSLDTLTAYVEQTAGLCLIGKATDPRIALADITGGLVPDILFTDINMPNLNGLEIAELLNRKCLIVFTTAHNDYASQAFEIEAYAYLLKPISYSKFLNVINRIAESRKTLVMPENYLFIRGENKGKMFKVNLEDIVYFESSTNYVIVSTVNENITTYMMIKEIAAYIPENNFSRVHRSFVINHNQIHYISGNEIVMKNGVHIPLSSSFKDIFLEKINRQTLISRRLIP